jgi:hypothetical protein
VWAEVEGRVRMTRWERRAALLVGVLGLGVAAVGCGAPERQAGTMLGPEGTVEADTESGPAATTPSSGRQAASELDPCALLDPQERSRAGLTSVGEPGTVAGSPVCDYVEPGAFGLTVTLDGNTALAELRTRTPAAEEVRVGAMPALLVADREADDGTCSVLLEAGETGTRAGVRTVHVDVTMADFHDTAQACERATTVAEAIEAELT